jgi:hypothetical protein
MVPCHIIISIWWRTSGLSANQLITINTKQRTMATKMRSNGGGNFEKQDPIPQGNHLGILYSIIEMGTVDEEYQGEAKKAFKVSMTWELPGITGIYTKDGVDQELPRVISKSYTLSAHEKSGLRKMIQSWRGKNFTDDEAQDFDIAVLLGKPCLVQVIHTIKGDNTYANIAAITGVPKGMPIYEQVNPTKYLSYDNFSWETFNALPKFLREIMEKTPEFHALEKPSAPAKGHPDGKPAPARASNGEVKKPGTWAKPKDNIKVQAPEPAWEGIPDEDGSDLPF